MAFFDPATYADTEAYQQLNSVIAIGSDSFGERDLTIRISHPSKW